MQQGDHEHSQGSTRKRVWRVTLVAVALAAITVYNLDTTRRIIAAAEEKKAPDHYSRGMKWVQDHVPIGARIYNVSWSDFPKLFFYDTSHAYVAGLDPTYLLDQHPELSRLYGRINAGQEVDSAAIIRDRFGARYVMVGTYAAVQALYPAVLKAKGFEKIYEDNDTIILRILP